MFKVGVSKYPSQDGRWEEMDSDTRRLRAVLPVLSIIVFGCIASLAAAKYINSVNEAAFSQAFDRDAAAATASIEREIERHVDVVGDMVQFTDSTWPGDIDQWRHYVQGRVTGGTHLGFSSTAGVIERVPADDLASFELREAIAAGRPFEVVELLPVDANADRLVLTRTNEDVTAELQIWGLEVTSVVELLGIELPSTGDGLVVESIDAAPDSVINLLGMERNEFIENDVVNTNVMFVQAVGEPGQDAKGWVVIPGELGYLLVNAIEDLEGGALNIAVSIPETDIDGDLGRYQGDPSTALVAASRVQQTTVSLGGWEWMVTVWAGDSYAMAGSRLNGTHLLGIGLLMTLVTAVLIELRRRHGLRLIQAEFEVELQRTLAETDPLTGLLNRQGLRAIGSNQDAVQLLTDHGFAAFFLDLNGFKAINDQHGHAAGDAILIAVARSVRSVARPDDYVGRLGGDEFVLICPAIAEDSHALATAKRIRESIRAIESPAPVDAAIGIALSAAGETYDFPAALKAADAAMYRSKYDRSEYPAAHLVEIGGKQP